MEQRQFICNLVGITDDNIFYENLKNQVFERVGRNESRLRAIEELGLLSDEMVVKYSTPIDTISKTCFWFMNFKSKVANFFNCFNMAGQYLSKRLALGPTDRDLVVLRHEVGILWPDNRNELRGINLVVYGQSSSGGYSAMARTGEKHSDKP